MIMRLFCRAFTVVMAFVFAWIFYLGVSPLMAQRLVAEEECDPGSTPIGGTVAIFVGAGLGCAIGVLFTILISGVYR